MTKTIAEQITDLETTRAAKVAAMEAVGKKSMDGGRSMDEGEQEDFDEFEAEVTAIDADLKRFRSLERIMGTKAKPVNEIRNEAEGAAVRSGIVVRNVARKIEPGLGFARVVKCFGAAKGNVMQALAYAEAHERYKSDEQLIAVLKASVPAGSVGGDATDSPPGWGGGLVGTETNVYADFAEFLRPQTILGRFGNNGIPSLRIVPFRVPLISQTAGGHGYWVGQGKAKPLTQFDFTRTTLTPLKVANIAVLTMELLRDSSPSADVLVRDSLAAALRERLDLDFVDPANAGTVDVKPASITNGITGIPSSGTDAAAVRKDIAAVFSAFIAANNPPTSGVWIMPTTTALQLSLMVTPLAAREFPGITMTGGTLEGLPVIASEYVPAVSPGAIVILVNASDIYEGDEGGVAVDMSTEASLEMTDAPTGNSITPTAISLVSMFQTNSVALRAERTISWKRRRNNGVAYLTGVNWVA
jgi:Phage capsid family